MMHCHDLFKASWVLPSVHVYPGQVRCMPQVFWIPLSHVTAFPSLTTDSKHVELKLVYLIKKEIIRQTVAHAFLPARVTSSGNWSVH